MNLEEKQLKFLSLKKADRYGGYGPFIGMCTTQAREHGIDFEQVVKENIDNVLEVDKAIDDYEKKKVEKVEPVKPTNGTPSF